MMKRHSTQLKYVLPRYGYKEPDKKIRERFVDRPLGVPFQQLEIDYAANDTKHLFAISKAQEFLLRRDGLIEVALLENKVAERYHDMKVRGIGFDKKIWRDLARMYTKEFRARMEKLPGEVNNWNSPKQVKEYFYKKGIKIDSYDEIDEVYLQTRNKILGQFIFARELHKAVTSYGLNWFNEPYINLKGEQVMGENFIDDDGRIRCDVTQIINTGRNSMSNPNLQQLPGKGNIDYFHRLVMDIIRKQNGQDKLKWEHRKAFIPKPGHVFVIGDFSGQEIGVMAAMAEEQIWIEALLRGEDVHGLTASIVDGTEWAAARVKGCTFPFKCKCPLHLDLREPAKITNFMLAYGGGAGKLAKSTGKDRLAAIEYSARHKRAIPSLTRKLEQLGRDAVATGVSYSADPYRRRRVLRGEEEWQVRNQGKNNPIQSAGSNMLKLAMVSLPWDFAIVLVIHDEIILEVPKGQANKASKCLKQVMEKSADYITGIKGLIKVEPRIATNLMKE
jgi:DNA polymerase-1